MTFEPDGGGWNNIRMAMETVVGLAIATGRTLVLPPEQRIYLLGQGRGTIKTDFTFMDFFPMRELAQDNDGLHIITTHEFLSTVAMTGQLRDKITGAITYPPNNRTDWDGIDVTPLKEYLRNVTHTPLWSPDQCLAVFPATSTMDDQQKLQDMLNTIVSQKNKAEKPNYPIPVDATTIERMTESLTGRQELCLYNQEMQQANVLHFMCYHKMRVRMLVHFYAFLFFEDYREDLWMKRYVLFFVVVAVSSSP
jgi:GDP-fucose protein O-fucosyltransferase